MKENNKGAKKMIASERYETILNLIQEHGIVKVKDLAKLMQVTETTIRRDCEELEHQGKLIRVHGGAKGINQNKIVSNRDEKNVRDRTEFSESKELVCKKAASFVKEGDCIFLDGITTVVPMVKYLKDKLDEKHWGEIPKEVKRATAIKTNYDTLRAIAYELQQGWSFEEAIEDLNIDKGNKTIYFNICYTQKNKERHSLKVPFVPSKVEAEKVKLSLTDKLGCIIGEAIFSTDDFYFDINDNDFKLNVEKATYQFNTVRRSIYKPQDGEEIVTDKDKENAVITEIVITNISEVF